ncbi:MAG: response regulator transcription factor [Synergistaceae bacterium]|jgi:DNA-binding NarL/FixJ family response regulator|nr:response regulator transcription factor [Synergistaceae bacterium]
MIKILLADDHPLTRAGLAAWIDGEPDFELIAEAGDGESAWRAMSEFKPDVALLDIEMPNGTGIEIAERATKAKLPVKVVMLTAYRAQQYVMASLRAGASGFVLKTAPFDQIGSAVRAASEGRLYLDASVSLAGGFAEPEELSAREKEVLLCAAQGMTGHKVASELSITERTVQAHLASVYNKLGAKNKTEAVLLALKRGIIFLDQLNIDEGEDALR